MSDLYYEHHVFCCTNRRPDGHKDGCCASKGGEGLRNYMKKKAKELGIRETRINGAGCLGRCELGPVVVIYPEGVWYSPKNESDIDEILVSHLQQGKSVERLRLAPFAVAVATDAPALDAGTAGAEQSRTNSKSS